MKLFAKTRTILTTASLSLALFAGTASAEYRVTAFGYSSEFEALLARDVARAKSIIGDRAVARLDFIEANNLCVMQILAAETELAMASCTAALEKLESDRSIINRISRVRERTAKASIYSNLAVARAMSGDMLGANSALETALSLNARDRNAISNYSLIHDLAPLADVARSL